MTPHLKTALTGPLLSLEKHLIEEMANIEHWFRTQWLEHASPFYASVDLRNAGFKLAPVDTNLFPSGFNNLNPDFLSLSVQATTVAIEKICPEAHRLLIVPENHTRNIYYIKNLFELKNILKKSGLDVRIGSLDKTMLEPVEIAVENNKTLLIEPLKRVKNRLVLENKILGNFDACAILLNNDLSSGIPDILKNIEQNLIPPLHAGWAIRRKSQHFKAYDEIVKSFSEFIKVDPWLINPYFDHANHIDFHMKQGEDELSYKVDQILDKIKLKYKEYNIKHEPFVIVKADAGTYGMGIMTVKQGNELKNLNRKSKNKMSVIKEGLGVSEVIIQEGVYSEECINEAVAEPVIYLIDHFVIGGFYRVHTTRGKNENLNAPGMHFVPLAFETSCSTPETDQSPLSTPNRFYAYGVIARLALLAASIELEANDPANT
ncbi:MAG: glutamate--cysteine ligase [Candidatus Methylopumilus sp.]|nr:glutamate--cysteine ligase [Candidatus Methylopumilus sp.]